MTTDTTVTPTEELSNTIAANYLLTNVTVRTYGGQRTDKELTAEIHQQKGAAGSTGRYIRNLFGADCKRLKEVSSAYNNLRNFMYGSTLPWVSDTTGTNHGDRLLPVAESMTFLASFAARKAAAGVLRDAMAADLSDIITSVRVSMGAIAPDLNDYPTEAEFIRYFDATLEVSPVPEVTDFSRLSVPGKLTTGLQKIYQNRVDNMVTNAVADAKERVLKRLDIMAAQLGKEADTGKARLYQSMIDNLAQEVALLVAIGGSTDTGLALIGVDIKEQITDKYTSVDMFKKNMPLSRQTAHLCRGYAASIRGEVAPEPIEEVELQEPAGADEDLDTRLEAALADMGLGDVAPPKVEVEEPDTLDSEVDAALSDLSSTQVTEATEGVVDDDEYLSSAPAPTTGGEKKWSPDVSTQDFDPDEFLT
jgi:hypothetical protein